MSVQSTASKVQYILSSGTQTLSVPFYFLESSHLKVIKVGTTQTVLVLNTDYTVTGAGVEAGGSVILTGTDTDPADVITIKRSVPITQLVDYVYNDRFPAETHERALDKLTMLCQFLQEQAERSLRFEDGEVLDGTLALADRKGKFIYFDATDGTLQFGAVQDLLDAADAAEDAKTAAEAAAASAAASALSAASYQAKIEVSTIAVLKALSTTSFVAEWVAQVNGYYQAGDGGGGLFRWVPASAATDNGGTVIAPTVGTGRWLRIISGGRYPATAFGVRFDDDVANAVTNAMQMQAAIDAVPSSGGVVVLDAGRAHMSAGLRIRRAYIGLEGVGPGTRSKLFEPGAQTGIGSRLVFTAAVDGIHISPDAGAGQTVRFGGITLRDFGLTGTARNNGKAAIRSGLLTGNGAIYGPTDDLLIERVSTIDFEYGAYLVNDDIPKLRDCWFTECGNGIYMSGTLYGLVSGCCIADNTTRGLYLIGGIGNRAIGNTVVRNIFKGIHVSAASQGTVVMGNNFQVDSGGGASATYDYQLEVQNSDTVVVVGNTFRSTGVTCVAAIQLTGSTANTYVNDNSFELSSGIPIQNGASGTNYFRSGMDPYRANTFFAQDSAGSPGAIGPAVFMDLIASNSRARVQAYNWTTTAFLPLELQQAGGTIRFGTKGTYFKWIRFGFATLAAGSVVVPEGDITADTHVFAFSVGGPTGTIRLSVRTVGNSFTLTSSNGADAGVVVYMMMEP